LLGIETSDFIAMCREVSTETYKNEIIKQNDLREAYRFRLKVNQIGVEECIDNLVQDFKNEVELLKGYGS
jgi:hypothetical protein